MCCDGGCLRSFHFSCLEPPLDTDDVPEEDWYCKACSAARVSYPPSVSWRCLHPCEEKIAVPNTDTLSPLRLFHPRPVPLLLPVPSFSAGSSPKTSSGLLSGAHPSHRRGESKSFFPHSRNKKLFPQWSVHLQHVLLDPP